MMPLVFSSSSIIPSFQINQFKGSSASKPNFSFVNCNIPQVFPSFGKNIHPILNSRSPNTSRSIARECLNSSDVLFDEDTSLTNDWKKDQQEGDIEDMGSPWEGAVVYQRNPSILHVEYCTTLERLGLQKVSTELSRFRASVMGLRVTKAVKDFPLGTPVLISVDVTRKKKKLRLDGIVRTVITLACNRCGEPTTKGIFSNFSLLLTEEPIEEPETINMGVIFGEDKFRISGTSEDEEDDDASIDLDDHLYFPPGEKAIDISKHVRDMVHVEITNDVVCDPGCKGFCLKCGSNLNTSTCICREHETPGDGYGPLRGLREQIHKN